MSTVIPLRAGAIQQMINRAESRVIGPNGSIYFDVGQLRADRHDALRGELHTGYESMLNGNAESVPGWRGGHHGRTVEIGMSAGDALMEALEHGDTILALKDVLKAVNHPLVNVLRARMQSSYVALNADGVFEARGLDRVEMGDPA